MEDRYLVRPLWMDEQALVEDHQAIIISPGLGNPARSSASLLRTIAHLMKHPHPLLSFVVSMVASSTGAAQCGPYKHHPLWPSTLGGAHVNLGECPGATSVLWDNGSTTPGTEVLTVGPHTVTFFDGSTPLQTVDFNIEQQHWALNQSVFGSVGTIEVSIWAEVDRCTPQIFDNLICPPDPSQTVLRLLQDGIAIDSLTPVDCIATMHAWPGLPFGHTYGTVVQSTGACPSYGQGPQTTAYDCSGFSMDIQTQDDQGDGTGSIDVTELIPGPPGPFTPPSPVTGHYLLFDENMNPIGDMQTGTPAEWGALVAGSYAVYFISDTLCSPVMMTVVIDNTTGIAGRSAVSTVLWPVPVLNTLHWTGSLPQQVHVLDPLGRSVLRGRGTGQVDVSSLSPGMYFLRLDDDGPRSFIKQ